MKRLIALLKDENASTVINYTVVTGTVAAAIVAPLDEVGKSLRMVLLTAARAMQGH